LISYVIVLLIRPLRIVQMRYAFVPSPEVKVNTLVDKVTAAQ
jgi:hypothetical protein